MKTWRERLADDRAAGKVSAATISAWAGPHTCPVGKGVELFGAETYSGKWADLWDQVNGPAALGFSGRFLMALQAVDFDAADRILDQIDDRVLELKREAGS